VRTPGSVNQSLERLRNSLYSFTVDSNSGDNSISAVVLSRNHSSTVANSLLSLNREFPGMPIILIDSASSDNTVEVARCTAQSNSINLSIICKNFPTVRSLAEGFGRCTTDYVLILSMDDELMKGYGVLARKWLNFQGKGVALNWALRLEDESGNYLGDRKPSWSGSRIPDLCKLAFKNLGTAPGCIVNRRVVADSELFALHSESLIEDQLMWYYLLQEGHIDKILKPHVLYRRSSRSLSHRQDSEFIFHIGYVFGFVATRLKLGMPVLATRMLKRHGWTSEYRAGFKYGRAKSTADQLYTQNL
jgi:glycosyltransferase involved in cell wall biosynthesis